MKMKRYKLDEVDIQYLKSITQPEDMCAIYEYPYGKLQHITEIVNNAKLDLVIIEKEDIRYLLDCKNINLNHNGFLYVANELGFILPTEFKTADKVTRHRFKNPIYRVNIVKHGIWNSLKGGLIG